MSDFIGNLESISELDLEDRDSCWKIRIPFDRESYFELTVPKDINEWFVSLYKSNEIVWSDWVDWYTSGDINKNNVRICFKKDIEYFIDRILTAADYKIVENPGFRFLGKEFLRTKDLELLINNKWITVEPGELPNNFEIP